MKIFDLFIIGGGINGTGIANEAALQGLSVMLCEQDDLASGTSSRSTKLIHGGLRYLEHFEFRLVREALSEREVLLKKAPHLIHPLEFVVPHQPTQRPFWEIRLGLWLYDHLGKRSHLAKSSTLSLTQSLQGVPLKKKFTRGFTYSDCWVDDSRLVVLNALGAHQHHATILTRTKVIKAEVKQNHWVITTACCLTGVQTIFHARFLINAAGPWVTQIPIEALDKPVQPIQLIQGSHIILPKLYDGNHAYLLQHEDHRVVFAIPYAKKFTLIGTTDIKFTGKLHAPEPSLSEKEYLIDIVNQYFNQQCSIDQILWCYAGVRPLFADESTSPDKMSRDYSLALTNSANCPPCLTIYGGKITTYRKVAAHALQLIAPFFPSIKLIDTKTIPLPGGDIDNNAFPAFINSCTQQYSGLPQQLIERLAYSYGTRIHLLLENINTVEALGHHFGSTLYEREIDYLIYHEWAKSAEDILWRRSKLGLDFNDAAQLELALWLKDHYQIDLLQPQPLFIPHI